MTGPDPLNADTEQVMQEIAGKPQHAPGPWFHAPLSDDICTLRGYPVAAPPDGYDEQEWQANGRLIAAAPDFYAAMTVEDIDQIIEGIENFIIGGNEDVAPIWQPYIDKLNALRAAILKVESRS